MSGKQALAKKEWLKKRFDEGLVFYRSEERGKCFIEYIPAENAWVPIEAGGWLYINCLWVSGSIQDTAIPQNCFPSVSGTRKNRERKVFAFCAPRDGNGNF